MGEALLDHRQEALHHLLGATWREAVLRSTGLGRGEPPCPQEGEGLRWAALVPRPYRTRVPCCRKVRGCGGLPWFPDPRTRVPCCRKVRGSGKKLHEGDAIPG